MVTALSGGGLVSGTALAVKSIDPAILVVAVEPEVAADGARTLAKGKLQRLNESPPTVTDGVRTLPIGSRTFEVMVERRLIDAVVVVSEEQIAKATATAWTRLKLALEPTGALPLAAHLAGLLPPAAMEHPNVLLLSGGNFDATVAAYFLLRFGIST